MVAVAPADPAAAGPLPPAAGRQGTVGPARRVLGVDACPAGWVGIVTAPGVLEAHVAPDIGALVSRVSADGLLHAVAIDIPLGLPDRTERRADRLARERLGPRRSSVFMTPPRAVLEENDHAAAVVLARALTGKGVSRQAHGLRTRVLEVDAFRRRTDLTVIETHPEVSFAEMAGAPLRSAKKTWAGSEERRALLAAREIAPVGDLGTAGARVGVDDVLDAAAAAWTAGRYADDAARPLPDPPEIHSDGIPAAIWV